MHTHERNTEPNKPKSKRTTRGTNKPKNNIKQLKRKLTKTENPKTEPKQSAN